MKKISLALLLGVAVISTSYAQDVDKNSFPNWDKVIKQAKQEGEVTFNIWYLQPQWRNFVKGFEDEYGIHNLLQKNSVFQGKKIPFYLHFIPGLTVTF
ncbi:hypothetical protein [Providencia stuartii]|uniref:hypothetical protein n=1 Tax=Providencia stuartii TaxID=588 RepID=UPI00215AD388|nr:hypothetical protein [Providencia stuartii]